jgi:transcriptional regulator with XRE-family HTH domain
MGFLKKIQELAFRNNIISVKPISQQLKSNYSILKGKKVEKMAGIREVLANNIKAYRRKYGFSQDKLAELAGISSQYLATVETCRKFPTPEVLDRLAKALGIETNELFSSDPNPQNELEKLRRDIIGEVVKTIKQAFAEERKTKKKRKSAIPKQPPVKRH